MRAHTVLGLFALYFFYLACFFGTITVFMPYVKSWESPSRHFVSIEENAKLDEIIPEIIKRNELTGVIDISIPKVNEKAIGINDQQSKTIYIDPNTNKVLNIDFENNFLSNFFNAIHIGTNIPVIGRYLMGIASILMIFLAISGFIMWINLKRKGTKKEKFWLKWHKNITLLLLPFILVFCLTGAVLGFMLSTANPIVYSATKTADTNLRATVGPILFPKDKPVIETQNAKMMKISQLQNIAQKKYPTLQITNIKLFAWNDINAKARFIGYEKANRSITARINRMYIEISAVNGKVVATHNLETSTGANKILSAFYFLHFITDEGLLLRVIYFILGIIMTAGFAFGFLIYSEKKTLTKKREDKNYYSILNKLSLSVMIGVIPSTALVMFLYWYFPMNMFERTTWLTGCFYALWAGTLLYAVYEENTLKVINHYLLLGAILLLLAVAFHGYQTTFYPWVSLSKGMYDIFFVDIVILLFAFSFYMFFKKSKNIQLLYKYDGDRYENK